MSKCVFFLLFIIGTLLNGQEFELPWLSNLGVKSPAELPASITTKANVTASDGLQYSTHTLYIDPQRAYFKIIDPDRYDVFGIDGRYYWTNNGSVEKEAAPFVDEFVRGHQFHAHILSFQKIHPELSSPQLTEFNNQQCMMIKGSGRGAPYKMYFEERGLPLGMTMVRTDEPDIVIIFSNWKKKDGLKLPFTIDIDDGVRTFQYQYTEVELNEGSADDFRLEMDALTEEQVLMRLHRIGMDDHYWEKTDGLQSIRHDSFTVLNRGQVFHPNSAEFDATMNDIMASRDHEVYNDRIRPIIKVSEDGTLGWVIVEMEAEGILINRKGQEAGELKFQSAWIELYEKIEGEWKMIGIVSNFLPER